METLSRPSVGSRVAALLAALLTAVSMTVVPVSDAASPAIELPSAPSVRLPDLTPATTASVAPGVHEAVADGPATVIVQLAPGAEEAARDALAGAGGEIVRDLDIISGFSALVDAASLDALTAVPGVRHVTVDGKVELAHTEDEGGNPNPDSSFVETIGADALHEQGIDGDGVGIAVIDTGVADLPDFEGRRVGMLDISGDGDDVDHYGHGTFIAGIAAGDGASSDGGHAGVAPGAHVIPVKIAGRNGAADVSHVLAAMQYVVSFKDVHDIDVLNLSVGTDSTQPQTLSPLNYAVERAWDAGITVVVSGGNLGEQGPGRIPKPADDPLVITVGATDSNGTVNRNDDEVAGYSSRGPSIADGFEKPDIVAPGSHLVSLIAPGSVLDTEHPDAHVDDAHARGSGTSFAAGVTSGAAALLLDAHPDWTPDQVKDALTSTAAPGPVGDRNVDGHGAVDVASAVDATPAPGSQGLVVRSSGLGSLEADRGSVELEISSSGLFNTIDYLLGKVLRLTGETTAQDEEFDAEAFVEDPWTEASWYGASWWGASWWGASWWGASWWGASWWGASWWSDDYS